MAYFMSKSNTHACVAVHRAGQRCRALCRLRAPAFRIAWFRLSVSHKHCLSSSGARTIERGSWVGVFNMFVIRLQVGSTRRASRGSKNVDILRMHWESMGVLSACGRSDSAPAFFLHPSGGMRASRYLRARGVAPNHSFSHALGHRGVRPEPPPCLRRLLAKSVGTFSLYTHRNGIGNQTSVPLVAKSPFPGYLKEE